MITCKKIDKYRGEKWKNDMGLHQQWRKRKPQRCLKEENIRVTQLNWKL